MPASGIVSIEYQLINQSTSERVWAPWEVTRVRAGGYTFAPRGPGNRTITQDCFQHPLPLSLLPPPPAAGGIEWLNYPSLSLTQGQLHQRVRRRRGLARARQPLRQEQAAGAVREELRRRTGRELAHEPGRNPTLDERYREAQAD